MENTKPKRDGSLFYTVLLVFLIIYTVSFFLPLIWSFLQTFRDYFDYTQDGPIGMEFSKLTFKNWVLVFTKFGAEAKQVNGGMKFFYVEELALNTILYTVGSTVAYIIAVTLMAYAVGRFDYKFSRFLEGMTVVVMSLPVVGSLPSEITMAKALGIFDTMWGMWIMKFTYNGLYFLVLAEAFRAIPKDYLYAASIDGAGRLKIMLSIMLPMVKNIIGTIALLQFVVYWNDYQTPLIYLNSKPTLIYGFFMLTNSSPTGVPDFRYYPAQFTACMLVVIPITALFIAFNKAFLRNITLGGIKE